MGDPLAHQQLSGEMYTHYVKLTEASNTAQPIVVASLKTLGDFGLGFL